MNLLTRNAAWMFGGQCLSVGFQTGYFILLARLLGPVEYGIYMGVVAASVILSQYTALGSGFIFLKHVSGDRNAFARYWGNTLLATAVAGIPLVLLLGLCSSWMLPKAGIVLVVVVGLGDSLLAQLTSCVSQVFQAVQEMQFTAGLIFLSNFLRFLLIVGMVLISGRATALHWAIWALVVSGLVAAISIAAVIVRLGRPEFPGARFLLSHTGEGLVFAATSSSVNAYNDLDKVLLSHYGMEAANGIYSVAYRIVNLATIPITSIYMAAVPTFFAFGKSRLGESLALTRKLLSRTAFAGCCSAAGMMLLAPILPRLLGNGFAGSVSALRWLSLIPLFRSIQWSAGDVLMGMGRQNLRLCLQLSAVFFNLVLNLYLIRRYSWHGAAWSSLATDGLLGVAMWVALGQVSRAQSRMLRAED